MAQPKIRARIKKERDLETHVRTQFVAGTEFVELRDYVPSTKTYSRGVAFESHQLGDVIEALQATQDVISVKTSAAEIPGQLALDV